MRSLFFAELFKVRKRWIPWILLGIMVAFLALSQFGMYAAYRSTQSNPPENTSSTAELPPGIPESERERIREELRTMQLDSYEGRLEQMKTVLILPRALVGVFSMAQSVGGILLVILAASIVGGEYAWGTVRSSLARGVGRGPFLASKLLALAAFCLAGLVVVFIAGVVFSVATSFLVDGAITWDFLSVSFIGRVLAMFGRTWFAIAAPVLMAVMVAVLTRSSAVAIGVGIGYGILEAIAVAIFGLIPGWGEDVRLYTIGYNTAAIMAHNSLDGNAVRVGLNMGNAPLGADQPGFWKPAALLVGYVIAFLALSFYTFRRRDLKT